MRRSAQITWEQVRVGLLLLLALVLLGVAIFWIGAAGSVFGERYRIVTLMKSAAGLVPGAAVQLAGQPVGQVDRIDFIAPDRRLETEESVAVWLAVNRNVQNQIRTDSRAHIRTLGLLGDRVVDIDPGSPRADILQEGDTLISSPVLDYQELLDEASDAVVNLTGLVRGLDDLTRQLLAGEGTMGQLFVNRELYDRLVDLSGSLSTFLSAVNDGRGALGQMMQDEALYEELVGAVASLDSITGRLARGEGSLGRLLESDSLYEALTAIAQRSDSLVAGLQAGHGSMGQLIADEGLYEELLRMVVELNNILQDLRADPDKYIPPIKIF